MVPLNSTNLFILLFSLSLTLFVKTHNHTLSSLLAIEFLALNIYISLTLFSLHLSGESFCSFYFLALAVCEGALGLSLVIVLVRAKGNDFMNLF